MKTSSVTRKAMAVIIVSAVVALGACTSSPTTTSQAPTLSITSPANGATLPAGNITVTVKVTNFNVVDKQGQANAPGEGHLHYFLDVAAPTTPGQPAIPPSGVWAHVAATSYTFTSVAPGTHTISVELVNNDHTPLVPPVVATVTITVTGQTTTTTTTTTTTPSPTAVTINLTAKNIAFNLSTITVPAGASVTINFDNQDSGVPHNFALYQSGSQASGTATGPIFVGQIVTGPGTATYTFTAPTTPGTYFFRCDVHPTIMTGSFIVQ